MLIKPFLEYSNESQDLFNKNVKKLNEEEDDFIGALQDIQVYEIKIVSKIVFVV